MAQWVQRNVPDYRINSWGEGISPNRRYSEDIADYPELSPDDLLSYMFFTGIFEGIWFYDGFIPIYALQRIGKMRRTAE